MTTMTTILKDRPLKLIDTRMMYNDGDLVITNAKKEDARELALNLRDEDKEEMKYMGYDSTSKYEESILEGYNSPSSECYSIFFKGKLAGIFGVLPMRGQELNNIGVVWLLTTPEIKKFKKRFLRLAQDYIEVFKTRYELLTNVIHPSNKMSIKLVKKLNAEIDDERMILGPTKENLLIFTI